MFGKKKQTHINASFFARIDQSDLSLDDPLIQDIAEKSGVIENWPNVSLADLHQFTTTLVNDVVRAGGHDIILGNVVYFETNDKGRAEPTGLSWEHALLTAGFENFAVSTADHIFNDTAIRQDEDMTYDIIVEALQPLMVAATTEGQLTTAELPVLPTEEEFRQARETGEVLHVTPQKFQLAKPEPIVEIVPQENIVEPSIRETDTDVKTPAVDTSEQHANKPTHVASVGETTDNELPLSQNTEIDPNQKLIDQVAVSLNGFQLSDVPTDLPAEDANYVLSRLNADKKKANDFLNETSNIYTQRIRKTLSELLKQQQSQTNDEIARLRETNVSEQVESQLKGERADEYEARYTQAHKAREAGYRVAVTDENDRHEQTLTKLKSQFVNDLEALKVSVNKELDDWFLSRSKELYTNLESTVANQVSEVQTQAQAETLTSLKILRDDLLAKNGDSLLTMQQKLEADLDNKRAQYQEEHEKAVLSATELESAKAHTGNLSDLQQQVEILTQSKLALEEKLTDKNHVENNEIKQLRDQVIALQDTARNNSHDDSNQQIMALLQAQMKPQPALPNKGNPWQSALIGVLAVVAIGSAGFGGYAMAQAQHHVAATSTSRSASSVSQAVQGNATVTVAPKSTPSSSASSSTSSSSSSATSDQSSNKTSLNDRYQVGETVDATINHRAVKAQVVSIQDHTITVYYDGYNYVVPIDN
ncbi:UNVERIFIED_ORG: hypothetical protein ABIC58_000065 [Leuconostoc holzapfelii]